jgi:hypothetical protein
MFISLNKNFIEVEGRQVPRDLFISVLIKKISDVGTRLSDGDLDWAIKMEDAYKTQGSLSDKQIAVLFEIYQRAGSYYKRGDKKTDE